MDKNCLQDAIQVLYQGYNGITKLLIVENPQWTSFKTELVQPENYSRSGPVILTRRGKNVTNLQKTFSNL